MHVGMCESPCACGAPGVQRDDWCLEHQCEPRSINHRLFGYPQHRKQSGRRSLDLAGLRLAQGTTAGRVMPETRPSLFHAQRRPRRWCISDRLARQDRDATGCCRALPRPSYMRPLSRSLFLSKPLPPSPSIHQATPTSLRCSGATSNIPLQARCPPTKHIAIRRPCLPLLPPLPRYY